MVEGGFGEVAASALVPSSARHLHPEEVGWEAMLSGWAAQMRSRALSLPTVEPRLSGVRRFMAFNSGDPWHWSPDDVDAWSSELLGRRVARSTSRGYQASLRLCCC